ncbi:MAG: flagellin [Terracidiphilus sp.]|jgi:flagellin
MALGVLNNLSAIYAENNLNNTNSSLQTVLQQLSSGSKINSGADDAAGLSLVNGLEANQTALTQSETNATEGAGLLQVADGALSQVTSLLDRAITLATEASNGTLNSTQEAAANQEYQSILAEVNNIGSTTTYNQEQVFNGTTVAIYTGDSSTAGSSLDDLNIRELSESSVGDTDGVMAYGTGNGQNGTNVFVDLSNDGKLATVNDSLATTTATSTSMDVTYLTTGAAGATTTATATITVGSGTTYADTAQGLINAINNSGLGLNATFTTAQQAGTAAVADAEAAGLGGGGATDTGIEISGTGIGTGTNGAGEVGTLTVSAPGDTLGGTLTIVGSDGTSHAILLGNAGSTDTIANLENTINTAGYGVTASLVGGALTFISTNPAVTVSATSALTASAGGTLTLTGTPTALTQYYSQVGTLTLAQTNPAKPSLSTDTLGGTLTIGSNVITLGTPTTTDTLADLEATINSGDYGVTATLDSTGKIMTFTSLNSSMTIAGGVGPGALVDSSDNAGDTGTLTATNAPVDFSVYYSVGITTTGITDSSTAVNIGGVGPIDETYGGTGNTGIAMDTNRAGGTATISYTDAAGESLSKTDLLNQTDAQSALNDLNLAISDVAAQDGYIGAQINTLNAISQVMSTQQENVVSAQNAVQATDYASATSNMSKFEILSQTGIAALAQANSVQQEVTKLLQ